MNSELISILLLAIILDRVFGEPPDKIHPTVLMGKAIDFFDRRISSGLIVFLAVTLPFSFAALFLLEITNGVARLILAAIILKLSLSWRGLRDYTQPIARALQKGDTKTAGRGIPFIAGRNPQTLNQNAMISTVVESIAESSVDSVLSPLFYFFLLSTFDPTVGAAAAVFYRAVNTLDSMLGVPDNPKGRFPAKADELLNLFPARIAAVLLLLVSGVLRKPFKRGLTIFRRDRNATRSKNSGQTMSAMAGILGVRLYKEGEYMLGDPVFELSPRHIYDAIKIVDIQIAVFVTLMVIAWI